MNKTPQIPSTHHSSAQWDHLYVDTWLPYTTWYLSAATFYSPPTSLAAGNKLKEVYHLSKLPLVQDLKAGRLTFWLFNQIGGLGDPCVYIGVTGVGSTGISFTLPGDFGVWKQHRFTWWQYLTRSCTMATIVEQYKWVDPDWILVGPHYFAPLTGDTNRVGIGATPQSIGYHRFFDNTILEKLT